MCCAVLCCAVLCCAVLCCAVLCCAVLFGQMVACLVLSLAKHFIGSFSAAAKANPSVLWNNIWVWLCVFDVFTFSVFLVAMVMAGAWGNDEVKRHKRILIHHRIVLRRNNTR